MDDPMMEQLQKDDPENEAPEAEEPEEGGSGTGDPETEEPEEGGPDEDGPETHRPRITLDEIVRRFGAMYGLTQEEAEAERELCAAALDRVKEERSPRRGGEGPLMDYAAALAGRRYILRCLARGITVAIGDPRSGPAGARSAAQALEDDYRAAASRWLVPKDFCFRQTAAAVKTRRCRWKR